MNGFEKFVAKILTPEERLPKEKVAQMSERLAHDFNTAPDVGEKELDRILGSDIPEGQKREIVRKASAAVTDSVVRDTIIGMEEKQKERRG